MDQLLDKPIKTANDDVLGFRQVADSLADAINAQPNGSSLTLGLDGLWGSGKSSILALLQESITNEKTDAGIGTVVVVFSPWLITNRTALVAAFFAQLLSAIEQAEKRLPRDWFRFKKSARRTLSNVKGKLKYFGKIASIVSTTASAFDPTLVSAAAAGSIAAINKLTDGEGKNGKTLETLKEELTTALSKIAQDDPSFRILVLIDDLDRLDPSDALEVLRLVKSVGDFPAVTYLLAYDRIAIAKAIEHSAKVEDGDHYLEKIIQYSFKVPPLEPFQLRNWLKLELERLYPDAIDYASSRASVVLDAWAGRLLRTPRDVKRLLFAVRALWPKLERKGDLLDLIWLQMIAQKSNKNGEGLYSWVVGYLQSLEAVAIGGLVTGKAEDCAELTRILKDMGWKVYKHRENSGVGSMDFHNLDEILAGVTSDMLTEDDNRFDDDNVWIHKADRDSLQEFRDEKRLSSPWHWRLYFALNPPSHAITDDEWQILIEAAKKSSIDLSTSITAILEIRQSQRRDAADQILDRASRWQSKGQLAFPDRWIIAITQQAQAMANFSRSTTLGFSKLFELSIKTFAQLVFKSLSGVERSETLTFIFNQKSTLYPAAHLLRDQYISKNEGHKGSDKCYLSDAEIAEAVANQLSLYKTLTAAEFRSLFRPYDVLYAWKDFEPSNDNRAALFASAFDTDIGFIETLSSLKYVNSSTQNGVPHIPENYLKHFVDVELVKKRLESLALADNGLSSKANELLKLWWASSND